MLHPPSGPPSSVTFPSDGCSPLLFRLLFPLLNRRRRVYGEYVSCPAGLVMPQPNLAKRHGAEAFSLVEILVVVALIGILAAVALPYVSQITGQSSYLVARQQQAELQAALGNWIVAQSSQPGGIAAARDTYATNNKIASLRDYLQASTYDSLSWNGTSVTTGALNAANAYLRFSSWSATNQPIVEWVSK